MTLTTAGKIKGVGLFSAILLVASNASFAVTPVGPGEYRIDTAEDVSYVAEGFAVPANAAITVRPGIFCPEDGPTGVDEVIWKNVKLTDIKSFTGRISYGSGDSYYWLDANCYHIVTNETDGYVQCQLQAKSSSQLHGFVMQYRQEGNDIKARIRYAKFASANVSGQDIGCDLTAKGIQITVTNTPYSVAQRVRAIADLGYILREDAEATAAPTEIILASTDESLSDEELYHHMPCLMNDQVTLCRNLRACDIVGASGEISHSAINSGKWTEVDGVCLTNLNARTVQVNLMWKTGTRRIGANVRFYQEPSHVQTWVHWAGHSYDARAIEAPFGAGIIGESLGITNEPGKSSIAVRNLKVKFRPKSRITGDYADCILMEEGWVKIWPDANLRDVTFGPALMGGYSLDSKWGLASNYLHTVQTYTDQSYYQYFASANSTLYTIRFLMQQQFGDIYAKVASARYNYGSSYQPGTNVGTATYQTTVTNIVNGRSENATTLAICHMTADHPVRKCHAVTVGDDFDPGLSPIRLDSVKLALAPSANATLLFESVVHGCGTIGATGAGSVALKVDLPDTVGLDVDSGTVAIDAPRAIGGPVNVEAGAALNFVLANGVRPALASEAFSIASGASIVLSADTRITDIPSDGETFKVVTGCNYAAYAFEGVTCRTSGLMDTCKIVQLFVDEDGDIAVTVKPRKGFLLTIH